MIRMDLSVGTVGNCAPHGTSWGGLGGRLETDSAGARAVTAERSMRVIGFTMMTDPDYRQDPWRECIRQALEVFDEVVVIYGREADGPMIEAEFKHEPVYDFFLNWPQPEWSYEELARHLNLGLEMCRSRRADWAVKFDMDYFIHESQKAEMFQKLSFMRHDGKLIATFGKLQFFLATHGYEKGKMYIGLNLNHPLHVTYGQDESRYTDLCQPVIWDGKKTHRMPGGTYDIPLGTPIDSKYHGNTGVAVWNYDYTFKTYERAKELLYHFDLSHARWWGSGYTGKRPAEITPETAMQDYLQMSGSRVKKCIKDIPIGQHPKHIQEKIRSLTPEQFGHSLWGKVPVPTSFHV